MKLKKRDIMIIAIILFAIITLIAVMIVTNSAPNNIADETNNGDFNSGNRETSTAEITDYLIYTNWQKYENHQTTHFSEDGIYHEIPDDDTIRNSIYSIYGNITNTGNTVLKIVEYKAVFYDAQDIELYTEKGWLYDLDILEKRPFNIWSSKSSREQYFESVDYVALTIVNVTT